MNDEQNPRYFLGIDGGGTKTYAVITNEHGEILGEGTAGGANPHNVPVQRAIAHIQNAIDIARKDVLTKSGGELNEMILFEGACLGLAGLDTKADIDLVVEELRHQQKRDQTFGARKLIMVNDGLAGLHSATDKQWGVSIIAGTGANCYGLSPSGKEAVAGDWGFLLGDQGSSFRVGQSLLRLVMKEFDGRKERSVITDSVLQFLGKSDVSELIAWAYHGAVPVHEIAQLSRLLEKPEVFELPEVQEIYGHLKASVVDAFLAVSERLEVTVDEDITVVLLGGLFRMQNNFGAEVIDMLKKINPKANVVFPQMAPAEGAAKLARNLVNQTAIVPESAYVDENHGI